MSNFTIYRRVRGAAGLSTGEVARLSRQFGHELGDRSHPVAWVRTFVTDAGLHCEFVAAPGGGAPLDDAGGSVIDLTSRGRSGRAERVAALR